MILLYVMLGIGVVFSVLGIILRKKAPIISLVMQILVIIVLVCTIVWAILNVPSYNAYVDALSDRFS